MQHQTAHTHTRARTHTNDHQQIPYLCFLVSGGPACLNFFALPCQLLGEPLPAAASLCLLPALYPLLRESGDLEDDLERELEAERDGDLERELERESEE